MEKGETEQDFREYLRVTLIDVIKEKYEFGFLEELCLECKIIFNEKVYDSCLDKYISLRIDGELEFKAKYAALFLASWKILYP